MKSNQKKNKKWIQWKKQKNKSKQKASIYYYYYYYLFLFFGFYMIASVFSRKYGSYMM